MFERVNMYHPDSIADRLGGALLDLAYSKQENPKVALEIMIGHGNCHIIAETSYNFTEDEIKPIVDRIVPEPVKIDLLVVPQDIHLANNQKDGVRCGDNGIFKGVPITDEEKDLAALARELETRYPYDGKYIIDSKSKTLIICQSNIDETETSKLKSELENRYFGYKVVINPLGPWTGSISVDTGCGNRKLGSNMAQSVSGGGVQLKDVSKSDVSANIYAFVKAQELNKKVELFCAIGDTELKGYIGGKPVSIPYKEVVEFAKDYIKGIGGFESFGEHGLL